MRGWLIHEPRAQAWSVDLEMDESFNINE